jgi:ankyrin repeat protein
MTREASSEKLFEAIRHSDVEGVKNALCLGADINSLSDRGRKPLFNAVGFENLDIIKLLLVAGANPTDGLVATLMRQNTELAKFLVKAGADIEARLSEDGQTFLHAAVDFRMIDLVRYLVEEVKANVSVKTDDGATPLELAEKLGLDNICEVLRASA